jgi:type I restriction enzyme, R subunit
MAKTIVFCDDQDHAERIRQELVKIIPAAASNRRYVMRMTSDDNEGKAQLSYFIDNDEPYPVIVTTSKLLTTGVDAKTCKLIVLDQNINSMTEFKQIIGRGTRLREDITSSTSLSWTSRVPPVFSLIRTSTDSL